MENDRGFKVIAIIALLIAVVGLSIAYAGYTATLTVTGTATVKASWDVKWTDLDGGAATGYANVTGKTLAVASDGQSISGIIGTLKAPGDTIKYTWNASNDGEIDATLTGVSLGSLSCAPVTGGSKTATQEQADALCAKLSVAFTYDSAAVTASTTGDLMAGNSKPVTMTITYAEGAPAVIEGDVEVTLSTTSFNYVQRTTS